MSLLDGLNPAQREAACITSGPVLILAGAGSGKTRTLTHRLAHLIETGVAPHRILAVTFTNKAANEMKERIAQLIGEQAARWLWAGTFHSVCARILRRDAALVGLDSNFTIYDADDSLTLLRRVIRDLGSVDEKTTKPGMIHAEISNAKNALLWPDDYAREKTGPFIALVANIYRRYQAALSQNNAVDFDDLLMLPVRLFGEHPQVLEEYRTKFQHLLIDEYQDTNHAQYVLVKLLAEKHHNVCAVGDDDQSIYGWRGADITNILNFERGFPEAKVIRLEQNYRSTQLILDAAGAVVKHNKSRKGKTLWTERSGGERIIVSERQDEELEAQWVRDRILSECRDGASYRDVVVLYRTNAQSRAIEEALIRSSVPIPYRVYGGLRFYERKEIKDILAYLRVIDNPRDGESLRRIINVPKRGIGDRTVERLESMAQDQGLSLFEVMKTLDEDEIGARAWKPIAEFVTLLEGLIAEKDKLPVSDMLERVISETGYRRSLEEDGSVEAETRLENLDELVAGATAYAEAQEDATVSAFLQEISLITDIDTLDESNDLVTLMTLHSAKGLEFPIVFIAGLEEGLFPLSSAIQEPRELEEERRLFYVGLTRAKERVFLTHARRRRRFNEWVSMHPSRFLEELPSELIEWEREEQPERPARPSLRSGTLRGEEWPVTRSGRSLTRRIEAAARKRADEFAQEMPDYNEYASQVVEEFLQVGNYVIHPSFGRGKVVGNEGFGDNLKVTIKFDGGQTKKVLVRFAQLEPSY